MLFRSEIERCGTGGQMFKALAYCNQRYVSSLKLVRERLMEPEDTGDEILPEENGSFHEDTLRQEDTGNASRQEENCSFHEDAGQPEEFAEMPEAENPEAAGFQKTAKGAWYAAAAGSGRQGAPAGKEVKRHGHGILK